MQVLKTLKFLFHTILLLGLGVSSMSLQLMVDREYQVKAVFLFNFTQFVEWPAGAFTDPETPLVIGVLGKNPFGNYLTEAVAGEKVNGHLLLVKYYSTLEEVKDCQILFINLPEVNKSEKITAFLKGKNILTVSDRENFLKNGGMIRFLTKNDKIQLQINLEAVKEAELSVSSKLLRLAEIITIKKTSN